MKILTAAQIRATDEYTIVHQPIKSEALMEKAATLCAKWLLQRHTSQVKAYFIFCGIGNNGGDGIVIAKLLHESGLPVSVLVYGDLEKASKDFNFHWKTLNQKGITWRKINTTDDLPEIKSDSIVIDALLGTGLQRPLKGALAEIVEKLNESPAEIIAIDVPTGLFTEEHNSPSQTIIRAKHTLTFQCPKFNFLLPDYYQFVGEWHLLDIGLDQEFIANQASDYFYMTADFAGGILKKNKKFDHKGSNGFALLIGGSEGKYGAICLSGMAAMRTGAGFGAVLTTKNGCQFVHSHSLELMTILNEGECYLQPMTDYSEIKNKRIGIGPGMGKNEKTLAFLKDILSNCGEPIVVDADAINLLASDSKLLSKLPKQSILTPHPKELARLLSIKWQNDHEKLALIKQFTEQHQCILVVKGAHTLICLPNGTCFFNSTGNAGMATAGSGDVLTGVITALLARGYASSEAAQLGVFLHGLAGDLAKEELGEIGMIASDLIRFLPLAIKKI
jgi:hydroxyethylthiazole kinase-like uncharacterized protein yjeF